MSLLELPTPVRMFDGLTSYSRTDVELINRFADLFRAGADWPVWVQEVLGALLETAGERIIVLEQTNQIEPGGGRKLSFQKAEITIGREPDNDVVIPRAGVGRHHARITKQKGRYFLEDLGSANGTYLNDARLDRDHPIALKESAQFLIFPDQFTFSTQQAWTPHEPIRVATSRPQIITWINARSRDLSGTRLFSVKVSPDIGTAVLRASEDFLRALVSGISHAEADHLIPADAGLFEFLLLSVLERANRELNFPYHFSLLPFEAPEEGESGISFECVLGLPETTGVIAIFLPTRLLRNVRDFRQRSELSEIPVSWPVTVTAGYSDLSLKDLTDLEISDVLLITSTRCLLLPSRPGGRESGWRVAPLQSDPLRLRIVDYFERNNVAMESQAPNSEQSDSQKPNLAALPVRVHIVLSELEMTLAELNGLTPGSIVELDREPSGPVQLAVNGKIAGAGELVEVEGRLGVRIVNWNAP